MKEEDVSWAHQRDFRHVRRVQLPFSELHGKILVPVRMIFANLQPQGKELHHTILVNLHKFFVLRRKHQGRRMTEIYKAEMSSGPYFAIYHRRDFARTVIW